MNRSLIVSLVFVVSSCNSIRADVVTDWNVTLNESIIATPSKHNPGTSTRAMAMMNAAIYDVFQAIDPQYAPFKVHRVAPDANLDAAVAQAAYRTIVDCFGEQQSVLQGILTNRLNAISDSPAKTAGIDLGNHIAQHYINKHANDGHDVPDVYMVTDAPGLWSSDPMHPGQKGWGKHWGNLTPWVMGTPAFLSTPEYAAAFNQVKDWGALNSASRIANPDKTAIGLFWAYDRPDVPGQPQPGYGPPPVLFVENLIDIADQAGNTPADNARLFAMASVAMADSAIASWDVKFETDFWRPITAIRADAAHDDDNALTLEDSGWIPLGAPGHDPGSSADDFTPPFPAYTSGHATMGGAVFKALELFYGTNNWDEVNGILGDDLQFELHSSEAGGGGTRLFDKFTQTLPLTVGTENSPEGENAISRIYLGIHWIFDATDGMKLGNLIAEYAAANHFQAVPEPNSLALMLAALCGVALTNRGRRAWRKPAVSSPLS
jgi:hypothetical protein